MALSPDSELRSRYGNQAAMERQTIELIDSLINNGHSRFADLITSINSNAVAKEIRQYVGDGPSAVVKFVHRRGHLWRRNGDEIQILPAVLRVAVVDLVASIVKHQNKAPLGDIFGFLQTYHRQALPYLPKPTNGSSVDAVKNFILSFPYLFRLINAEDGNEWTRTTPLGQVLVECVVVVVNAVILLDVKPPPAPVATTPPRENVTADATVSDEVRGIGEIIRLTPVWGYLQSNEYGPVFFTSSACRSSSLHEKGLKLGLRVYFEAKYSSEAVQIFNNVPVKLKAYNIRPLTAAEELALVDALQPASSINDTAGASASAASPVQECLISISSPAAPASLASSIDSSDPKRMPAALADWLRQRKANSVSQNQTNSSKSAHHINNVSHRSPALDDMQAALQALEDELQSDVDTGYAGDTIRSMQADNTGTHSNTSISFNGQPPPGLNQMVDIATNTAEYQRSQLTKQQPMNNDVSQPGFCDAAIQTDVTDEELLLRLIRTAPELLDLVQVVMRR